jgi:hypothetical protein
MFFVIILMADHNSFLALLPGTPDHLITVSPDHSLTHARTDISRVSGNSPDLIL